MTPTTEILELRGEVGALWNAMRGPVKEALRGLDPDAAWAIGGGTILAARCEIEGEADTGLDGMTRVFETPTETGPMDQSAAPDPGRGGRTPGG